MKMSFYASACVNGLHGGGAYLNDTEFRFRSQKMTIAEEYKNLRIPYEKIKNISTGKSIFFIPTTVIETTDGNRYRFLIFNRKKFMRGIRGKVPKERSEFAEE